MQQPPTPRSSPVNNHRHITDQQHQSHPIGKAKSEIIPVKGKRDPSRNSMSQSRVTTASTLVPYLETNIGDTGTGQAAAANEKDILKMFMRKKESRMPVDGDETGFCGSTYTLFTDI